MYAEKSARHGTIHAPGVPLAYRRARLLSGYLVCRGCFFIITHLKKLNFQSIAPIWQSTVSSLLAIRFHRQLHTPNYLNQRVRLRAKIPTLLRHSFWDPKIQLHGCAAWPLSAVQRMLAGWLWGSQAGLSPWFVDAHAGNWSSGSYYRGASSGTPVFAILIFFQ